MRGLPAIGRAVPVRLLRTVRRALGLRPQPGESELLRLIAELPPELRARALTHSSQVTDRVQSNERLEFLGDSVLGLAITSEIFHRYPEWDEGDLARLKAYAVSRASCAEVAERMGVQELMAAEGGQPKRGLGSASRSRTVGGNALEALLGAVYLTFGFERARRAVVGAFEEQLGGGPGQHVDPKTALQELLAARGLQPEYRLISESGPAHAKLFNSEVYVGGRPRGEGQGTTIKMSEQEAARVALASYSVDGSER